MERNGSGEKRLMQARLLAITLLLSQLEEEEELSAGYASDDRSPTRLPRPKEEGDRRLGMSEADDEGSSDPWEALPAPPVTDVLRPLPLPTPPSASSAATAARSRSVSWNDEARATPLVRPLAVRLPRPPSPAAVQTFYPSVRPRQLAAAPPSGPSSSKNWRGQDRVLPAPPAQLHRPPRPSQSARPAVAEDAVWRLQEAACGSSDRDSGHLTGSDASGDLHGDVTEPAAHQNGLPDPPDDAPLLSALRVTTV